MAGSCKKVEELSTAVKHGIEIVAIVFADGAYGNCPAHAEGGLRQPADRGPSTQPEFPKIAETFGPAGVCARRPLTACAASSARR